MEAQLQIMVKSRDEHELSKQIVELYDQNFINEEILRGLLITYNQKSESTNHRRGYTRLSIILEITQFFISSEKHKCHKNFALFFYSIIFTKIITCLDEFSASKLYKIFSKLTKKYQIGFDKELLCFCNTFYAIPYCKKYIEEIVSGRDTNTLIETLPQCQKIKHFILRSLYKKNQYICEKEVKEIFGQINADILDSETLNLLELYPVESYVSFFPLIYSKTGHRNLARLFNTLSNLQKNTLLKHTNNITLHFYLNDANFLDLSTHFCQYLRIKYLEKIENVKHLHSFIKVNQFIDDTGLRNEYIMILGTKHKQFLDQKSEYIIAIYNLSKEMCTSEVYIRRELGANILALILSEKSYTDIVVPSDIIKKLIYDPFLEIREKMIKFVDLVKQEKDLMLENLLAFEYCKINPTVEMIGAEHKYFMHQFLRVFTYYENKNMQQIPKHPIYGFLVLINYNKLSYDLQLNFLYKFCMENLKKKYNNEKLIGKDDVEQLENEKLIEIILWRTLKEVGIYFCNKIDSIDNIGNVSDIMLQINHLGIYTHLYNQVCEKFKTLEVNENDSYKKITDFLNMIEGQDCELSRKGAGISLLLVAFTNLKDLKSKIYLFLVNELVRRVESAAKIDTQVIYTNTIIKLASCSHLKQNTEDCIIKLTRFAFNLADNKTWQIKNVSYMLFVAVIKVVFGKNTWNSKYKKHITHVPFKELLLNELKSTKNADIQFMILVAFDRYSELQIEEYNEVKRFTLYHSLHKVKANKIIANYKESKINNNQRMSEPSKDFDADKRVNTAAIQSQHNNLQYLASYSYNEKMIKLYEMLNNEEKNVRDSAVFYCFELGFDLVSDEYMKTAIIKDSIKHNYIDKLKKTVTKPKKILSEMPCFEDENLNGYFDYNYNINLILEIEKDAIIEEKHIHL